MTTPTHPHRLRRVLAAALLSLGLVGAPVLTPSAGATATAERSTTERSTEAMTRNQSIVLGQINATRSNNGRRRLAVNGLMNRRAQRWAAQMRACQCLKHRAPPFGTPRGWCAAAENVGRSGDGGKLQTVHYAFLNSPSHRRNILNRRWTAVGVGVARDRAGEYFVVHAFADFSC